MFWLLPDILFLCRKLVLVGDVQDIPLLSEWDYDCIIVLGYYHGVMYF